MIAAQRNVRIMVWTICAAALLGAAPIVSAQTIYRVADVAGNITFTDRRDTATSPQAAPDQTGAPARSSTISSRRAALINSNEAARRLAQAQLKRKQGMAPLPGERAQGTDAGAVNHRYWQRQEKLRRVVDDAQRRSSETLRQQVAQR